MSTPFHMLSKEAIAEGRASAEARRSFRDSCPYTYNNFPGMTTQEFHSAKRPLMDAWFKGWKDYLDEHGLGYNFAPIRRATTEPSPETKT